MTDTQETLRIVQANRRFYEYMIEEKDQILQGEIQKVENAKKKFQKMFRQLQTAPKQLLESKKNEKLLQVQIEKEREIPCAIRSEVMEKYNEMKRILMELGIIS